MSECILDGNLELTKQQKLLKIIMEEGEKIHRMKESEEKKKKEEILNFLVELQSLVSGRLLHEYRPN